MDNEQKVIDELCNAIRLTVEYVGTDTLPPIPGWSWYDALVKYAPEMAQNFTHRDADDSVREDNNEAEEASNFIQAAKGVVYDTPEESNHVIHARRELKLISEDAETIQGFLNTIQAWSDMGHSGESQFACLPILIKLLNFENLAPLTDDPEEWVHHTAEVWGEPGGIWQNVRNGEAFSNDGGKTYTLLSERIDGKDGPIHESEPAKK